VALLVASACAVASRARRLRRERRVLLAEPGVGSHELRAGFDLVTLPGAAVVAYSLGGGAGRRSCSARDYMPGWAARGLPQW
jgi:hypothetical protein